MTCSKNGLYHWQIKWLNLALENWPMKQFNTYNVAKTANQQTLNIDCLRLITEPSYAAMVNIMSCCSSQVK